MTDSMQKIKHQMAAEESIDRFIRYLERDLGVQVSDSDQKWLYEKGQEIFDLYYIDKKLSISVYSKKDREALDDYFQTIQETFGYMFAHVILTEFKLRLLEEGRKIM